MNPISLAVLALIALVLAFTATRMIVAISGNYSAGRRVRAVLRERVNRLRLGRMLERRGIDVEAYLHDVSIPALEAQVRACENCEQSQACNRTLARGRHDHDEATDLSFCPNDAALRGIAVRAATPESREPT